MGLYRSVWIDWPCEHCGRPHRQDLQFKTGRDHLEEYELGQVVGPEAGLDPDQRYPGTADLYCGRCVHEWGNAKESATRDAMAALVELGRLQFRKKERPDAADYDVLWDGVLAVSPEETWLRYLEELHGRVDADLRRQGWRHGREFMRQDLVVTLDRTSRIRIAPV